jgi:hypothetical protein
MLTCTEKKAIMEMHGIGITGLKEMPEYRWKRKKIVIALL